MRFWVSWYQSTEDYRPVKWPLPLNFIGYWNSGCADEGWTLCAMIDAEDEDACEDLVSEYWPEFEEWRFCETTKPDALPGDRFPIPEWSPVYREIQS